MGCALVTGFQPVALPFFGAIQSVFFGGFAPRELATRIDDCQPKMIVASSCGLEPGRVVEYKPLLDQAIELATHKPDSCLIFQRPMHRAPLVEGRDPDLAAEMEKAAPADCVPVAGTDPLYILSPSGKRSEGHTSEVPSLM